ncbi:WhiB family transcriptional regulator [Mycobacterium sp. SVM_VP21]|nr:WhiB family transcriptional regulator [Mycobacterium sp. SVM_VP21]
MSRKPNYLSDLVGHDTAWKRRAACEPDPRWTTDTEPAPADLLQMRVICHHCPVRIHCLEHAITTRATAGVYAGIYLPPPERKTKHHSALLRAALRDALEREEVHP